MKNRILNTLLAILFAFHISTIFGQERISDWRDQNNFSSAPKGFTRFGDKVYFAATDFENGTSIWITDGTSEGTKIFQKGENYLSGFIAIAHQDTLYYLYDNGVWRMALDGKPEKIATPKSQPVFDTPWVIENRIWFSIDYSYDINTGKWESTSYLDNQPNYGYPYHYGTFIFNKDFITYQYHYDDYPPGSGKRIEIRDSSNYPIRIKDSKNQILKNAFASNGKKYGLFSNGKNLNLFEFNTDTLAFKASLVVGPEYHFTVLSDWNQKRASHLISRVTQNPTVLYEVSANGINEFKNINHEKERWSVISLDFEKIYVVKTDSSTLQNSLWRINLMTFEQQFVSNKISSGYITLKEPNLFYIQNDLQENEYYRFIIDKEKLELVSSEELISSSAELGKSKILALREAPNLPYYATEPFVIEEDTVMLKNIKENGGINNLQTFNWDGDYYFLLDEKDKDLSIYKLNTDSNELTYKTSFLGGHSNSSYVSPFSGKNNSGAVFTSGMGSADHFYILKTKDDIFELNNLEKVIYKFWVNSEGDLITSGDGELLKYNLEKKEIKSIWKNEGFNEFTDLNDFLKYKDWIFRTLDQSIFAFNTASEELIRLSSGSDLTIKLWNNRLISTANDSLFLFELDYNFEKRLLLKADYLGGAYDFQFTDSTFALVLHNKVVVSDGTCENTVVVHEGNNHEIEIINQTTAANKYAIYDKLNSNIILYSTKETSEIKVENINPHYVIFTQKSIYYQTIGQDSLMQIDLESKEIKFITQLKIEPNKTYENYIRLISQNAESLYFRIGQNLIRLDKETNKITIKTEPLGDGYLPYISFGKGLHDITLINDKPYLINKADLSFSDMNFGGKDHANYILAFQKHWIIIFQKDAIIINQENLENQIYHWPKETNHLRNFIIKNQKLYATANDSKYGDQVWFIAEIEGLEKVAANKPIQPFGKLSQNKCFQILATEESNDFDILIYPNPSAGRFKVQLPMPISDVKFEMYETSGKKIDFDYYQLDNANYYFNIDNAGLKTFILKVISPDKSISKKVIQSE